LLEDEIENEDEIEFEVVDLAGDDISDLWEGEPLASDSRRVRSAPQGEVKRSRRPNPAPSQSRQRPEIRKPVQEPEDSVPQEIKARDEVRRGASGDARRDARVDVRRDVRSDVRGDVRSEVRSDVRREPRKEERAAVRRDVRRPEREEVVREESRPVRRSAASRPAPIPAPPEDDDDGYTVDNSWVADDPRDVDAPKRRPVPTWRRVVDHIVDRNLGSRRGGGGGGRGRSGAPPRANRPVVGGRGDVTAPRSKRENLPTYLDVPVDDFEEDTEDSLIDDAVDRGPSRRRDAVDYRQPSRGRAPEGYDPPARNLGEPSPRGSRRPRPTEEYRDPEIGRDSGREPIGREPQEPGGRSRRPPVDDDPDGRPNGRGRRRY